MKKYILLLFAFTLVSCAIAQSTATVNPRFGTTKNDDNTGRVLTYAVVTTTDLAQAALDTILLTPNAFETVVFMKTGTNLVNLQDSVCYKFSSKNVTYRVDDRCIFHISKGVSGAGKIKFGGSQFIMSTLSNAVLLPASKALVMQFRWNGTKWIEFTRMVQP